MSATNSTANYELPIFLATDKPAWLTDWNGAMNAIDSAIHSAQSTADGAQTTAGTAIADIATINASLTTITGNITSLTTTVNGNTGSINTINSLIGNGQPTTEDKTIIGAINEIYAMIGGGSSVTASVVSYDNTTSGLTADDVQEAIDELAGKTVADLDFVTSATATITPATGVSISSGGYTDVKVQLNADKSIGKIYGGIYAYATDGNLAVDADNWFEICTLSNMSLPTISASYEILAGAFSAFDFTAKTFTQCAGVKMVFNTNGTVTIKGYGPTGPGAPGFFLPISLQPCIYILKDLGD